MRRIYHTFDKWECYPAGFYEPKPPNDMTPTQANKAYAAFLRDLPLFERSLKRVLAEWPNSCEHYLSNEKMNRIAWLGQASVCVQLRIPHGFRGGFNMLSTQEQVKANKMALKYLNIWLTQHDAIEVDMEGAGVSQEVNLY